MVLSVFKYLGEEHDNVTQKTRAYDWVRGTFNGASKEFLSHHQELNSDKFSPKFPSIPATGMSHQQILRNRGYGGNVPDGNSHGGSSKHSDSMSDEVPPPHRVNKNSRNLSNGIDDSEMDGGHIPYEVLIKLRWFGYAHFIVFNYLGAKTSYFHPAAPPSERGHRLSQRVDD